MKKMFLLCGLLALACSPSMRAQVTCYPESESTANDFWCDHFYAATCTDYAGTGSKLFEDGSSGYTDFNGGSSIVFTKIHTAKDATFTVTLTYGVGWADAQGAVVELKVNGEYVDQLIFYAGDRGRTMEFDVELYSDYDNEISLKQVKDWALMGGIQLTKNASAVETVKTLPYTVAGKEGKIALDNLEEASRVQIFSVTGQMLQNAVVKSGSAEFSVQSGLYIVSVNGTASKTLVK